MKQKDTVSSDEKRPLVEMTENGFGYKNKTPKIYTKPLDLSPEQHKSSHSLSTGENSLYSHQERIGSELVHVIITDQII